MADTQWGRNFFINAASAGCFHLTAEAITTVDGEHVGYLCPHCDSVLPPSFGTRATPEQEAAAALTSAGFDPDDVRRLVAPAEHPADACPARVEVTGIADREPQYVHGNCAPTAASR